MLLENRIAVIYGSGTVGGAMARAFAREGASVFLASRTGSKVEAVAAEIRSNGGRIQSVELDALDEQAVEQYVDSVVEQAGRIDISCNVIGLGDVHQPLMEISIDDFLRPIHTSMRTQFLTTRAAARHMIAQGSGVVLSFGGSQPQAMPGLGGFKIALDALAGLRGQWATELGEHGIRVVTLKSGGIPEGIPDDVPWRDAAVEGLREMTLLKRTATLEDVGNVAAFIVSDKAGSITSTEVNISCGAIMD